MLFRWITAQEIVPAGWCSSGHEVFVHVSMQNAYDVGITRTTQKKLSCFSVFLQFRPNSPGSMGHAWIFLSPWGGEDVGMILTCCGLFVIMIASYALSRICVHENIFQFFVCHLLEGLSITSGTLKRSQGLRYTAEVRDALAR